MRWWKDADSPQRISGNAPVLSIIGPNKAEILNSSTMSTTHGILGDIELIQHYELLICYPWLIQINF